MEGSELEPGVKIIEMPGHAPGHVSVVVDTPDGAAVVAGDAFPDAATVRRGRPYLIFWSEREDEESVRKIRRRGNIIYPGHDRPFRIEADGSIRYLGGADTLKVRLRYDPGNVGVSASLTLDPARQPWSHPAARG